MKIKYPGLLPESEIFSYTPGPGGETVCFYPVLIGEYQCDENYHTYRSSFDSFLLMYVKSGSGYARTETKSYTLSAGDVMLLDCYIPHSYGTNTGWEIQWLHFDGPMARAYFERVCSKGQQIRIANHYAATHSLRKMLNLFYERKGVLDVQLSRMINDLLTDLILYSSEIRETDCNMSVVDECIRYITDNLQKDISVEELAEHAKLSPFYFSRLFKEQTGVTPHRYIIMVRLDYSRYILRTTEFTIKETAFQCGFRSESNFCTRFRKAFGMTPQEYRVTT